MLADSIDKLFTKLKGQKRFSIPTGLTKLDEITTGMFPGELTVLAGRPGMGKSALAMNIAENFCLVQGRSVIVFSLEMSTEALLLRLLCGMTKMDSHYVQQGEIATAEMAQLEQAAAVLREAPLVIDDRPGLNVDEVKRRAHDCAPLDLVVVDYLQLMQGRTGRNQNREREVAECSAQLKALSKELHCPVLALSQLNRQVESRTTKRPYLSDLRESGAIEQDADVVILLYRDEVYRPDSPDKGKAELIIAKHRNGALATVKVAFDAVHTTFSDMQRAVPQAQAQGGSCETGV